VAARAPKVIELADGVIHSPLDKASDESSKHLINTPLQRDDLEPPMT
jgi:hypothetical protein